MIQNLSLTKPDTNILYVGMENRLKVLGLKDYSNIKLICGGVPYPVDSEGNVVLLVGAIGKGHLQLFRNSKAFLSKEYDFKFLPRPKSSLTFFTDTTLSVNTIRANPKVIVYLPECVAKLNYRVAAFKLDLIDKYGSIRESFEIQGDQIPLNILEKLSGLESGDKLRFFQLRVQGPDDERYSSFEIYIK